MMEQQLPKEGSLFELQVDYESGNYFKEAAKWAKFIAIVFFVFIGIMALALLLGGAAMADSFSRLSSMDGNALGAFGFLASATAGLVIGVIFIVLGIFTVLTVLLYRFASLVQLGIRRQDQVTFNRGLKSLRLLFIIGGVLTLLSLVSNFFGVISAMF